MIMEEINRSGGNAGACHGQMYNMGTLLRHGSAEQKARYLPRIATGELRLQSMGVTEPDAGTRHHRHQDLRRAPRRPLRGERPEGVDLARPALGPHDPARAHHAARAGGEEAREGLSIFLVDLRAAIGNGLRVAPIANMVNHETNELFFEELEIPAENLIGEEGQGFRYILDGLNAERTLIAAECIGDGYWFIDKATRYAGERVVFGRPIGRNQGVQFPIAEAYIEVEAADLMRYQGVPSCSTRIGPAAPRPTWPSTWPPKASWEAANVCLQTHGGFGFAREYDVERKFRETRLYQVAPISTNLILALRGRARARSAALVLGLHSTVTDFARLRGLSTSVPRTSAAW